MAASQKGVYVTQEMCHILIFFHNCSMIKDKLNVMFFCHFLYFVGFLMEENPVFCYAAIAESSVF